MNETKGIAFDAVQRAELHRLGKEQDDDLMGLALSGGGIRSATFNLGVLQALAKLGLLKQFEYLSTVSGGGYIGSWLSAWVARCQDGINEVEEKLGAEREPREVKFLREYSNYLTPRIGWLSADTLTGVATYLRNMLLNLTMIVAVTAFVLLVPWLLGALGRSLPGHAGLALAVLAAAIGGLAWAVTAITRNVIWQEIEEYRAQAPGGASGAAPAEKVSMQPKQIALHIVLPLTIWAAAFGLVLHANPSMVTGAGFLIMVIAAGAALVIARVVQRLHLTWSYPAVGRLDPLRRAFAILAGTAVGVALMWTLARTLAQHDPWHAVVWGVPGLLSIFLLAITFMLGIGGRIESEYAREWWSRLAGLMFRVMLIWLVITAAAVYGPWLARELPGWIRGLGTAWILTTIGSVLAARSPTSGKEGSLRWMDLLAKIGPYVFIVGLLVGVSALLFYAGRAYEGAPATDDYFRDLNAVTRGAWILGAAVALALVTWVLSATVDINLFSFHMFYRNRLVRCYLGASNPKRNALPFIGFDPRDNPKLTELAARPFHLINTALNLTSSKRLGWQERKAGSFVLSPLYCGYDFPAGPTAASDPCYQPTANFVKKKHGYLNLGTAMAVSGAAASPNMGYHSSPSVAFLLTVFNLRLGWWIQNPSKPEFWEDSGPRSALKYLLWELFGITNELTPFVYVSDGGHFDNLGLYELVRRRCRFIVVSDAGEDGKFQFEDLGNAVRKCQIDFGCAIDIRARAIIPDPATRRSRFQCAVGTVRYRAEPQDPTPAPGYILYLKSSLSGSEPSDVLQYAAASPQFPHESTQDQWFSESQFESYRKLGFHAASSALRDAGVTPAAAYDREAVFVALSERWFPPASAGGAAFARHGAELKRLEESLRSDPNLRFLDGQIYPEWETLMRGAKLAPAIMLWLPEANDERRAGFHFCNSLLQMMENVYVELHLEEEHAHPDHRGWMNLFQHWSGSGMFLVTYAVCCSMYGARFQRFCERRLGLRPGELDVVPFDKREVPAEALNFFEKEIIQRLENAGVRFDRVHLFKSNVSSPTQLDPAKIDPAQRFSYTFGFALTQGDSKIVYFRIQDHLRRMSFGRAALSRLYGGAFAELAMDELKRAKAALESLEPQELAGFERLFRSVERLKDDFERTRKKMR